MIGIILWAILIFVIMCYACPGFFTALIVITASVFAAYGLIMWLCGVIAKTIKSRKRR